MDMNHPGDFEMVQDGIASAAGLVEEPIIILRYTSTTLGEDAEGEGNAINTTNIAATATVSGLTARDINYPGSIFAIGDLRIRTRTEIFGLESAAVNGQIAARPTDQVVYRGRVYRVIGHVRPVSLAGVQYYSVEMRQG